MPNGQNEQKWFAVRVKPRQEKPAAHALQGKGYQVFLPLYRSRRRWSDRIKYLELPLFPDYVFCKSAPDPLALIVTTPGVLHVVGAGKVPVPVDEQEIAALQAIVESGLRAQPYPFFLNVGQIVLVHDGPLSGLQGIVLASSNNPHRLVVSITLLRRSVAVSIDRSWARPVGPIRAPDTTAPTTETLSSDSA